MPKRTLTNFKPYYVWCPQYCCSIYESSFEDLAVCRTRAKARKILQEHKKATSELCGWKYPNHPKYVIWRIVKKGIM